MSDFQMLYTRPSALIYKWNRILNFANWRFIRGVADLQILTKISYVMLVAVPLLAGTWPAVRLVVNQHNRAVEQATEVMDEATKSFETALNEFESIPIAVDTTNNVLMNVSVVADDFLNDVRSYRDDFAKKTLEKPVLPATWVRAFCAALLVALAHMIYQLMAPELVRKFGLDDFIRNKKQDYVSMPSDLTIRQAREFIRSREGQREKERFEYEARAVISFLDDAVRDSDGSLEDRINELSQGELQLVVSELSKTNRESRLPDPYAIMLTLARTRLEGATQVDGKVTPSELSDIEKGANAEYLVAAGKYLWAAYATGALYFSGLYLLALIVIHQLRSVLSAAGISSLLDVFTF